jgi:5'-nucleotidase
MPAIAASEIKGIRVARQARGCWQEEFEKRKDPMGKTYYWLTGRFINHEPESTDTDEWAMKNGYVSVVPVSTDMTAYGFLNELKTKF